MEPRMNTDSEKKKKRYFGRRCKQINADLEKEQPLETRIMNEQLISCYSREGEGGNPFKQNLLYSIRNPQSDIRNHNALAFPSVSAYTLS